MTAMMDKLNTQPRHLYSNLVRGSPGGPPPPLLVLLIHPRIRIQEYPFFFKDGPFCNGGALESDAASHGLCSSV